MLREVLLVLSRAGIEALQLHTVVGGTVAILDGRLNGDQITFKVGDRTYAGRVAGDTMAGDGWSATKK